MIQLLKLLSCEVGDEVYFLLYSRRFFVTVYEFLLLCSRRWRLSCEVGDEVYSLLCNRGFYGMVAGFRFCVIEDVASFV